MPGWTGLKNQPGFNANHMMLLTDGTVLVQQLATANWHKLTPDATGSYVNGTWSTLSQGPNGPTYYASAVMSDGRVFIAGGEDNFGQNSVDINACEIYDPVTDSWTTINGPGWPNIGDAPCCMLPDGTILLGSINDTKTAIYNAATNSWSNGPAKNDVSSEETWTLLPDQTVLVAECTSHPAAEKYVAASDKWVSARSTPAGHDLVQSSSASQNEIGPAILMTDGRVFAIGASGHTALYTTPPIASQPGTWAAGPDFPADESGALYQAFDAPAVLLPNGNVLCLAGPVKADGWAGPCHCYEFDGGTQLTPVPDPPNAGGTTETWQTRMLLLPTGEVLLSAGSNDIRVYQPDGGPELTWAPFISSCPKSVYPGQTYTLEGMQLNGLSQANSYGDDATMATNFPLVRIKSLKSGHVVYCRTHSFSTMGVATGAATHSTQFDVPAGVEFGPAVLCVVANGIEGCTSVWVGPKLKLEKSEIKEKDSAKVEIDITIKHLHPEIPKWKESEGDPRQSYIGDPAWLRLIQMIVERTDQLQQEITQLRSFIRADERPEVGAQAVSGPEAAPTKPSAASPKIRKPNARGKRRKGR